MGQGMKRRNKDTATNEEAGDTQMHERKTNLLENVQSVPSEITPKQLLYYKLITPGL
jgi:hypothetical protein